MSPRWRHSVLHIGMVPLGPAPAVDPRDSRSRDSFAAARSAIGDRSNAIAQISARLLHLPAALPLGCWRFCFRCRAKIGQLNVSLPASDRRFPGRRREFWRSAAPSPWRSSASPKLSRKITQRVGMRRTCWHIPPRNVQAYLPALPFFGNLYRGAISSLAQNSRHSRGDSSLLTWSQTSPRKRRFNTPTSGPEKVRLVCR
jgi:hypothetical protein